MDSASSAPEQAPFAPSPNVLIQQLPDAESVLLQLEREEYFGLNAVGTRFWQALVETATVDQAHARLVEEFDADPERLRADLNGFIEKLYERGLLVREAR